MKLPSLKERYTAGKVGDVEVKEKLFIAHQKFFADAIERRAYYAQHMDEIKDVLNDGAKRALIIAQKTLEEAKDAVGL